MGSLIWKSLALFVILTASVFGQTNFTIEGFKFDFQGSGARAEGMGKAFLSVSDDNTAGSWNPAGLYELDRPILSISYGSLTPKGESETINEDFILRDVFDPVTTHSGNISGVSGINFVAPLRIKGHPFVGSFSYTRNNQEYSALNQSFDRLRVVEIPIFGDQSFFDSTNFMVGLESQLKGGLASVNFGLGSRIYKNYSFGVALNVYAGNTIRETSQFAFSDSVTLYPSLQIVRGVEDVQVIDTNKFSGFNFTIGTKYNGEKLNAALVVRTPFALSVNTGKSIFVVGSINELPIIEGTDTTYFDDILVKYDVPLIIGAGISYQLTEKLLFAMDAEYKGFSGSKVNTRDSLFLDPGGDNTEYFTEIDPEWNSVLSIRMGGEYKIPTGIGTIPVRAGFGYLPRVIPNTEPGPNVVVIPDTVDVYTLDIDSLNLDIKTSTSTELSLSLGTGIWWKQIHLDFAYSVSFYDRDAVTFNRGTKLLEDLYTQKNKDHHFNFTFTGYF